MPFCDHFVCLSCEGVMESHLMVWFIKHTTLDLAIQAPHVVVVKAHCRVRWGRVAAALGAKNTVPNALFEFEGEVGTP